MKEQNTQANKQILAEAAKTSNSYALRKIARQIEKAPTFDDAKDLMINAMVESDGGNDTLTENSLAGQLFNFIAKQTVKQSSDAEIYGNVFKVDGKIDIGAGLNEIIFNNNNLGAAIPPNYQTSTDSLSSLAWGSTISTANQLNLVWQIAPLSTFQVSNPTKNFNFFKVLQNTVPYNWFKFSSLDGVAMSQIANSWSGQVKNSMNIYYTDLGNYLFKYFLPTNSLKSQSTNMYDAMKYFVIPLLERMKQLTSKFNAFINLDVITTSLLSSMEAVKSDIQNSTPTTIQVNLTADGLQYCQVAFNTSVEAQNNGTTVGEVGYVPTITFTQAQNIFNLGGSSATGSAADRVLIALIDIIPDGMLQTLSFEDWLPPWGTTNGVAMPRLNNGFEGDATGYCNIDVMSALQSLLRIPGITTENMNLEFNNVFTTKIDGIPIKVTGTDISLTDVQQQGTALTQKFDNGQVLPFGQIVFVADDYIKWYEIYNNDYTSDQFIQSQVQILRKQLAYLPTIHPFANGLVMDLSIPLSAANALPINNVSNN